MPGKPPGAFDEDPVKMIERWAAKMPEMPPKNRANAIYYLRNYALCYFAYHSNTAVPDDVEHQISELEAQWQDRV